MMTLEKTGLRLRDRPDGGLIIWPGKKPGSLGMLWDVRSFAKWFDMHLALPSGKSLISAMGPLPGWVRCSRKKDSGSKTGLLSVHGCYWFTRTKGEAAARGSCFSRRRMMKLTVTQRDLEALKEQLQQVRRASLAASQRGDFRAVGRLTCQAAQLNRSIQEAEGMILEAA
jgi:hypothetical protein